MDIVEQMRSLESDHEPDGWPAVTMGQISALCDKVDRLRSLIEQERQESLTASCRATASDMELDSANPILAQQSPAVTNACAECGADDPCLALYCVSCISSMGGASTARAAWRASMNYAVKSLAECSLAAPSPSITEQDAG